MCVNNCIIIWTNIHRLIIFNSMLNVLVYKQESLIAIQKRADFAII